MNENYVIGNLQENDKSNKAREPELLRIICLTRILQ